MKTHLLLITLFLPFVCIGQLQKGIKHLDRAEYDEAAQVLATVISKQPENKTAQICFGRAIGLAGNSKKAIEHFKILRDSYQNDSEVLLNLGEAYLWDKKPESAQEIYNIILNVEKENFNAFFGIASSLSMLNKHLEALSYINKALDIQENNQQALTSKKYILLAISNLYRNESNFDLAINYIDQILSSNSLDREALLTKADVYLALGQINSAKELLEILQYEQIDSFQSSISLSYVYMLKKKFKTAISYADKAVVIATQLNKEDYKRASIQKLNALAASKNFKAANELLDTLESEIGSNEELQLAKGRIKVWAMEYEEGLKVYDQIENKSFELRMGQAEAHMALREYTKAVSYIDSALIIRPNQIDALKFKEKLKTLQKKTVVINHGMSSDIAGNQSQTNQLNSTIPLSDDKLLSIGLGRSVFSNMNENSSNSVLRGSLGLNWTLNRRINLSAGMSASSFDDLDKNKSILLNSQASLSFKLNKSSSVNYSYKGDFHTYSANLTSQGISLHQHQINYQFNKPFLPGLFIQLDKTFQSDDNERNLLFASSYYEIKTFPMLKGGLNFNYISYKESRNEIYFSPSKYISTEVFVHFGNVYATNSKLKYSVFLAIGQQVVESSKAQTTNRVELTLSYQVSKNFELTGKYQTNSSSSNNLLGYRFQSFNFSANMKL